VTGRTFSSRHLIRIAGRVVHFARGPAFHVHRSSWLYATHQVGGTSSWRPGAAFPECRARTLGKIPIADYAPLPGVRTGVRQIAAHENDSDDDGPVPAR
jgi:hypothetical protein